MIIVEYAGYVVFGLFFSLLIACLVGEQIRSWRRYTQEQEDEEQMEYLRKYASNRMEA